MQAENLSFSAMARLIAERDQALKELADTRKLLDRARRVACALAHQIPSPADAPSSLLHAAYVEALGYKRVLKG